jgi:hypothetical protein
MPVAPGENWEDLRGHWVELRSGGRVLRTGEVEDVTADSSALWLSPNGVEGRQLIAKTDGYELVLIHY